MPSSSDVITHLVTTGFGVTFIASVLSGVYYVVIHGIRRNRNPKKELIHRTAHYCEICGTQLTSSAVNCSQCKVEICQEKCAKLNKQYHWLCRNCSSSSSWFHGLFKNIQRNKTNFLLLPNPFGIIMLSSTTKTTQAQSLSSLQNNTQTQQQMKKEEIRDFIEKLISVMLGDNVDNASVSMISDDDHYITIFNRYHHDLICALTELGTALYMSVGGNLPISGTSPCTAHTTLKELIENFIKDAANLPKLRDSSAGTLSSSIQSPAPPPPLSSNLIDDTNHRRSYEDLLATAIINKVISSNQLNLPTSASSSRNSVTSSRLSNYNGDDKGFYFGEETLDSKWQSSNNDLDRTSSVSSLEEWMHSESASFGSRRKYVDKVTLTIKEDSIEEVDGYQSEDDDFQYFRSKSSLNEEDESNWYLQKRPFHQSACSPVPVPMLVPDPTTDAKVLIGDRPLDDTSDLSDVGSSDFAEDEIESNDLPLSSLNVNQYQSRHSLLLQSKNIIGGGGNSSGKRINYSSAKLVERTGDEQSESSTDSGVKEVNGKEQKAFDLMPSTSVKEADVSVDDDNVEDSSYLSIYSNTQNEAEYTEKYATLPKQIFINDSSSNSSLEFNHSELISKEEIKPPATYFGDYSKREKEKWKHTVEMKNNPYSKENIEQRLKRSNSSASSDYGADYYKKLAKSPKGDGITKHSWIHWPPPQKSSSSPSPPPPLSPPSSLQPDSLNTDNCQSANGCFDILQSAAVATTTSDVTFPNNNESSASKLPQANSSEFTSDSDLSSINLYNVEHSQVIKKTKNENVCIPIIKREETIVEFDENACVPTAKPKSFNSQLFIKSSKPVVKPRNQNSINSFHSPAVDLKRHYSESNLLLEDSFYTPPKVLHHRKDNTLISKIYKDPKVASFARKNRDFIFRSQSNIELTTANNSVMYLGGNEYLDSNQSSDDGMLSLDNDSRMSSFVSSHDDDSLNETELANDAINEKVIEKIENINCNVQIEDAMASPNIDKLNKFLYGSQDNLLGLEEPPLTPTQKKRDNTIIAKIYKDPNVLKFAQETHGDCIPEHELKRTLSSATLIEPPLLEISENLSNAELLSLIADIHPINSPSDFDNTETVSNLTTANRENYNSFTDLCSSPDISLKSEAIENSETHSNNIREGYNSEDPDILEIEEKHVVRNILNKLPKSDVFWTEKSPNTFGNDIKTSISVKDLKKKFEIENTSNNKQVISSLTARSLSKQVKDILKM